MKPVERYIPWKTSISNPHIASVADYFRISEETYAQEWDLLIDGDLQNVLRFENFLNITIHDFLSL